jgi:Cyclic nucleotide-binding domain
MFFELATKSNLLLIIYNVGNLMAFLAFWPKDILQLRWFMAWSMGLLSIYFYTLPGGPILNALLWMVPTFLVNIWMIIEIHRERIDHGIADDLRPLYNKIAVLTPGQFRKLTAESVRVTGGDKTILVDGQPSKQLHFLLKGEAVLDKGKKSHRIQSGAFLGEVGFINNTPATGTVRLVGNAECLSWESTALHNLMKKDMTIDIAMRGIFNHDLAAKLANSVPLPAKKQFSI